ncbi:MAG: hypothetical protein ACTSQE_15200, partial [Candidatus Heimdallarchaeaceae archaeon]
MNIEDLLNRVREFRSFNWKITTKSGKEVEVEDNWYPDEVVSYSFDLEGGTDVDFSEFKILHEEFYEFIGNVSHSFNLI